MKEMNKTEHPRGLLPPFREEWHILCERLFELYDQMPMGEAKRKILAGGDETGKGNMLIFFKGEKEDLFKVMELLYGMD